ncbi:MAG: ankyrin repeat domain-containing protein [Alphaproteobacteria bacterium]
MAKRMIVRGADVLERQGNRGRQVIFDAAGANDAAFVQLLLSAGADVVDEKGATPIFAAARRTKPTTSSSRIAGKTGVSTEQWMAIISRRSKRSSRMAPT